MGLAQGASAARYVSFLEQALATLYLLEDPLAELAHHLILVALVNSGRSFVRQPHGAGPVTSPDPSHVKQPLGEGIWLEEGRTDEVRTRICPSSLWPAASSWRYSWTRSCSLLHRSPTKRGVLGSSCALLLGSLDPPQARSVEAAVLRNALLHSESRHSAVCVSVAVRLLWLWV